jgi:hypothetical protein
MEDIVAGIEAAVPAIEELEGTAKLFLLLRNTLVRPLNAGPIEELKGSVQNGILTGDTLRKVSSKYVERIANCDLTCGEGGIEPKP